MAHFICCVVSVGCSSSEKSGSLLLKITRVIDSAATCLLNPQVPLLDRYRVALEDEDMQRYCNVSSREHSGQLNSNQILELCLTKISLVQLFPCGFCVTGFWMIACTQEQTAVCNFCTTTEISKSNLLWFYRFMGPLWEWPILHSAHLEEIYSSNPSSLFSSGCCVQYSQVFVAVEREAHNIRLRVGSNDVLAKVSPNYLASPI